MHNGIGNQMFIYASCLAISKKLNRQLFIDDESAFKSRKNNPLYGNYSEYELKIFNISSTICSKKYKFLNFLGYLKRKLLMKINYILSEKIFYIEGKEKKTKLAIFDPDIHKKKYANISFIEGHFESEKYFEDYKDIIKNEFTFKNEKTLGNLKELIDITNNDSVALCLRRNRFTEHSRAGTDAERLDSITFEKEQIEYIEKAILFLKKKISKPKFFLWSNNYECIEKILSHINFSIINTNNLEKDFYLMVNCKHFIVIPSTFNWWSAWLSKNNNKIITRPGKDFFSRYKFTNDFWPDHWYKITK